VTIWFVVADQRRLHVQHARGPTADWFKNLRKNPAVQVDLGDGPLSGTAREIADPAVVASACGRYGASTGLHGSSKCLE